MTLPAHSKHPEDDVRQVLRKQVTQGALYQVVRDLFYDRKCVDELATVVTTLARDHGTVEAAQYRDAVGLGRKRAIQILEFFDRVGHTRRFRDSRVLRPDSTWHTVAGCHCRDCTERAPVGKATAFPVARLD